MPIANISGAQVRSISPLAKLMAKMAFVGHVGKEDRHLLAFAFERRTGLQDFLGQMRRRVGKREALAM